MLTRPEKYDVKKIIVAINRRLLGLLFLAQGIYILRTGRFFNFHGQPFVDASQVKYLLGPALIAFGVFILHQAFHPKISSATIDSETSGNSKSDLGIRRSLPIRLKVTIAYFFLYAFTVESFVFWRWAEWQSFLINKSEGAKFGYLMQGPLLGILFIISIIGLVYCKRWGRKWAVASLIIATLVGAKSFAWGYSGGVAPTATVYLGSLIVFALWNGMWLYLLYSPKVNSVLTD